MAWRNFSRTTEPISTISEILASILGSISLLTEIIRKQFNALLCNSSFRMLCQYWRLTVILQSPESLTWPVGMGGCPSSSGNIFLPRTDKPIFSIPIMALYIIIICILCWHNEVLSSLVTTWELLHKWLRPLVSLFNAEYATNLLTFISFNYTVGSINHGTFTFTWIARDVLQLALSLQLI